MSPGYRQLWLTLIGVAVLVIGLIVLIRNKSLDDELLASIAVLGGIAIIVTSIPTPGGG
jgi:hypothetical protein